MVYNGDITALNIENIANITVLKDINYRLLYGTQASNGVNKYYNKKRYC